MLDNNTLNALLLTGLVAGCSTPMAATTMQPVTVKPEYKSDTQAAIQRALAAKRYAIESEEAQKVIARWSKGDSFYRLAVVYEGDDIDLKYLDSNIESDQPGMAPKVYVRYMRKLRGTIEKELGRPMREAADADAEAAMKEKKRLEEEKRRHRAVLVTGEATPQEIREAIGKSLAERGYAIESEEGTKITARWNKGDLFYRLEVSYTPKQIDLKYLDSDHSNDDEDDGVQIVDEKYIDYMRRLATSIEDAINGG